MSYIIAGTGTRKLASRPVSEWNAVGHWIADLVDQAQSTHDDVRLMSGGAVGFDHLICRVAQKIEVPYTLALPNDGYLQYYWRHDRDEAARMLRLADEIVYVCNDIYVNVDGIRTHSNFVRNTYMVNNSDFMVVYDATSRGTAHCLREIHAMDRDHAIYQAKEN